MSRSTNSIISSGLSTCIEGSSYLSYPRVDKKYFPSSVLASSLLMWCAWLSMERFQEAFENRRNMEGSLHEEMALSGFPKIGKYCESITLGGSPALNIRNRCAWLTSTIINSSRQLVCNHVQQLTSAMRNRNYAMSS